MTKDTENKVPQIRVRGFEGSWKNEKLKELVDVFDGTHQTPNYTKSGVMFLSVENIDSLKSNKFISQKDFEDEFKTSPQKGDVLMTRIGDVGTANVVESTESIAYYVSLSLLKPKALDPYFLKESISSPKTSKDIWYRTLHIAFPKKININEIEKVEINFPTSKEQQKIGSFFKALRWMTEQHQSKHDKLVTLKQVMLQKMFPQDGSITPEIRFHGFNEDWEREKLGSITQPTSNNSLPREKLNYKSGFAKNIHYGDILVKFGEVIDITTDELPFITDAKFNVKLMVSKLQDGDIILADAAEDSSVGKCSEIFGVGNTIVLAGLHTIALRPLLSFAPAYLGYFMNSHSFHDQLMSLMQGTKVLSISKSAIKNTYILFPKDIREQQKIGAYFRKLDELILNHAIQLEKLKQLKSACLAKMFV
jgi:type I restriction enzyme, S subunit